jgi:hypothetical protein
MELKKNKTSNRLLVMLSVLALSFTFLMSSCKDDDPEPVNESELITTVIMSFLQVDESGVSLGEDALEFTWTDSDGPGPAAPVIDNIVLAADSYYRLSLTLLDESKNPAEDITEEIEEEDDEHQFFFIVTGANLEITYNDEDGDGNPVGLLNNAQTGDAGQGTLRIVLRHEPNKDASGVSDGNLANAGGDTDLDITFPVTIE